MKIRGRGFDYHDDDDYESSPGTGELGGISGEGVEVPVGRGLANLYFRTIELIFSLFLHHLYDG